MANVPQTQDSVEFLHRGLAIECGTVEIFLSQLRHSATVLLMPLERTIPQTNGWLTQMAIHLTARKVELRESPVYYCTLLAVELLGIGDTGRIIAPYREERPHPLVTTRANHLTTSLQRSLLATLKADPRVSQVLVPARYRLPDAWVWNVRTSLEGTSITLQEDRWTTSTLPR